MNFVLRIVFTLLAVACAACCIFIFVYFSWWGFIPLAGAVIFGALMYYFAGKDKKDEEVEKVLYRKGDFITGPVHKKTPEEIAAEEAAAAEAAAAEAAGAEAPAAKDAPADGKRKGKR